MTNVSRLNEIYLGTNFFPIIGEVYEQLASVWPEKQITGDYTKDSDPLVSSWNSSDHRGGIGIKDMRETKDAARSWWSTCAIGYYGHLILPPLVTDCGNATSTNTDAAMMKEFNNEQYVAFGTDLRKWIEGTAAWGATLGTLVGIPTDVIVHKSKLYFAGGTDFNRWDGTTLTTGAALSGAVKATRYFVEWDGNLFRLSNAGALSYSTDEGVTWTTNAASNLEAGFFTSLFLARDSTGTILIHLGTKQGPFILDYTNSKWLPTDLTFPTHDFACQGATRWREATYIPVGMGVYKYETTANEIEVTPMGPDRDFGIPNSYRGNIIALLPEHNALYAFVDATSEQTRNLYAGDHWTEGVFYDNQGYSVVLKWTGLGWQVVKLSGAADEALKCAAIGSADGEYRLWFGMDRKVFYIPLNLNLLNPIEVTTSTYASSSEHIWPWFDADNAVVDKLLFNVVVYIEDTSATEYAKLYYGLNGDDDTWTLLTNTSFPDGQIDTNGEASFTLASSVGVAFKSLRFKAELARGSTTTVTPDIRWLRANYIKVLEPRWSWSVNIDCSRDYRFKKASTLVAALKTAAESGTLGEFVFRTFQGTTESKYVRVLDLKALTTAGRIKEGQFKVTLIAPI